MKIILINGIYYTDFIKEDEKRGEDEIKIYVIFPYI